MSHDETMNPFQLPRLDEIRQGKKFWGYLDTEALQMRYVLAAHFVRDAKHVMEIGGYRDNVITNFLTGKHESVSVYSLDAEFEPREDQSLNDHPCRIQHIRGYFQDYDPPESGLAVVALGLEVFGDMEPLFRVFALSDVVVLGVPDEHQPSIDCLNQIMDGSRLKVRCSVAMDFSANGVLLAEELEDSNMNVPFWKRSLYVLEPIP